ncbi:uncharacterized protein LOC105183627 [Harpegnathos saltator]|uniref:uncharacterized protein LOC105183627 n=1 Tax=Harpegnathos saltator TaxID=610380 RepID=UPI000DBEDA01|nr:uncharacterized protein LOC105183627 [Harpegnathos saltator]XP_025155186.1 uncharacterized protein LOC105183627 [Harpegnathos saltator]XP_025155187.1 uncharacterized protein LOC105183627 [Harpegnathos saltator]
MVRVCSANNCSNKYSTGIKFRRCPCIPHLQQQWLEKLNRSTMGNEFYLSEEHFSREDLQTNTRSLIPIIFCNCSNTCRSQSCNSLSQSCNSYSEEIHSNATKNFHWS